MRRSARFVAAALLGAVTTACAPAAVDGPDRELVRDGMTLAMESCEREGATGTLTAAGDAALSDVAFEVSFVVDGVEVDRALRRVTIVPGRVLRWEVDARRRPSGMTCGLGSLHVSERDPAADADLAGTVTGRIALCDPGTGAAGEVRSSAREAVDALVEVDFSDRTGRVVARRVDLVRVAANGGARFTVPVRGADGPYTVCEIAAITPLRPPG
ncbi:MAG: hypothetical protein ACLGIR_13545 [Actinomycetes bacterium]